MRFGQSLYARHEARTGPTDRRKVRTFDSPRASRHADFRTGNAYCPGYGFLDARFAFSAVKLIDPAYACFPPGSTPYYPPFAWGIIGG